MLRKLIVLGITTGLTKKALDMLKERNAGVADAKWRPSTPVPRAKASEGKSPFPTSKSHPSTDTKPDAS